MAKYTLGLIAGVVGTLGALLLIPSQGVSAVMVMIPLVLTIAMIVQNWDNS